MKDDKGGYKGQVSLAFLKNIPLWIVGDKGEELKKAKSYKDLRRNAESSEIPAYVRKTDSPIKTSIIYPVTIGSIGGPTGVVNFESPTYYQGDLEAIWQELNYTLWLNCAE